MNWEGALAGAVVAASGFAVGYWLGRVSASDAVARATLTVTVPLRSADIRNEKDGKYVTASGHAPSIPMADPEKTAECK